MVTLLCVHQYIAPNGRAFEKGRVYRVSEEEAKFLAVGAEGCFREVPGSSPTLRKYAEAKTRGYSNQSSVDSSQMDEPEPALCANID